MTRKEPNFTSILFLKSKIWFIEYHIKSKYCTNYRKKSKNFIFTGYSSRITREVSVRQFQNLAVS